MLDFRTVRVSFDSTIGKMQVEPGSATFKTKVLKAGLAINGWNIQYDNGDHHVEMLRINAVDTQMKLQGNNVSFPVEFLIQDEGGPNDPYSGWVEVLVTADVQ